MASKQHCDICDTIIGPAARGGHVDAHPLDSHLCDGQSPIDLCDVHYSSYKRIVREWTKFEQGFVPSWPRRAP